MATRTVQRRKVSKTARREATAKVLKQANVRVYTNGSYKSQSPKR